MALPQWQIDDWQRQAQRGRFADRIGRYTNQALEIAAANPARAAAGIVGAAAYGVTSAAVSATGAAKSAATKITDHYKSKKRDRNGEQKGGKPSLRGPAPTHSLPTTAKPKSQSINSSTANMPTSTTITAKQDDVPIMPIGRTAKSAPDYITLKLPWARRFDDIVDGENQKGKKQWYFRLNSIYDVAVDLDGSVQPQARDEWMGLYNYYRVLACDVKVTFINNLGRNDRDARLLVGYQWGDTTDDAKYAEVVNAKLASKRSKQHILLGPTMDKHGNATTMTYSYNESDWTNHINKEAQDTIWTEKGANPGVNRLLRLDVANLNEADFMDITIVLEMEYTVQLREPITNMVVGDMTPKTVDGPNPNPNPQP